MPRVTYTAQVENITGKLGGSIFKGVKAGSILRRGQRSRQPQTAKQQETRGLYNTFAGQWYALPATTKEMWNKFASLLPKPLTAFNAYLGHNIRLIKAGHADLTEITSPAPSPSTPEHITGHELLRIASTTMRYQWTGPSDTSNWVEIYWAVAAGYDATGKQKWRHVDTTRSDDGYIEWANDYPLETPIHARARTIDVFGRISPWTDVLRWEHGIPAPIGTGCVLYLPMDEGEGTIAFDHSGNQNNGQITGATWVTGKYRSALHFDNLDDHVNCANDPTLDLKYTFTGQFLIYPYSYPPDYDVIITKGNTLPSDQNTYQFLLYPNGRIRLFIGQGSGISQSISPGIAPLNQWTHILAGFNGSNLYAYNNGSPVPPVPQTVTPATFGKLILGGTTTAYTLHASLDQLRLYNRLLTQNQAYDHYSRLQ